MSTVRAGAAWIDVDPFAEALSAAEQVGATPAGVRRPPRRRAGAVHSQAGHRLQRAAAGRRTDGGYRRTILGAPLFTSPAITAGTVYGIPADRVVVVMRDDVRLEVSREAYSSSDRVAVKATMRVGFALPHAAAVVKVALNAAP